MRQTKTLLALGLFLATACAAPGVEIRPQEADFAFLDLVVQG